MLKMLARALAWVLSSLFPEESSRRPCELPSADDVQVEVVDGLAPAGAVVDDDPEALAEVLVLGDLLGRVQQVPQDVLVALVSLGGERERGKRQRAKARSSAIGGSGAERARSEERACREREREGEST